LKYLRKKKYLAFYLKSMGFKFGSFEFKKDEEFAEKYTYAHYVSY